MPGMTNYSTIMHACHFENQRSFQHRLLTVATVYLDVEHR